MQRGRSGGEYDRFRERIMFPIRDRRGRVLGFGGRAMRSDQGAKYVNTAETEFFHKSQILYGVDRAKAAIAKAGRAVVVEGYTDVLALHQAGIEEAVGVMGTAITGEQVAALSGMVDEVVLALDADSAGQEAMLRAQSVAAGRRMRLRVAAMPAGEDPAEMMAAAEGTERFRELLSGAEELVAFQVGLVLGRTDARLAGRARPGAGRGRPGVVRDGGDGGAGRPGPSRRRAARPRPGDGDGKGGRGDAGERRRRADAATARKRRPAPGRRTRAAGRADLARTARAGAPGDVHRDPQPRARSIWRDLPTPTSRPTGRRAAAWLREHPEDPASNLPHDDGELAGLIAELVIMSREEPASHEAMELNFLLLEQRRLEDEIAAAGERGDYERRAALSRERAALVQRIAHAERPAGSV